MGALAVPAPFRLHSRAGSRLLVISECPCGSLAGRGRGSGRSRNALSNRPRERDAIAAPDPGRLRRPVGGRGVAAETAPRGRAGAAGAPGRCTEAAAARRAQHPRPPPPPSPFPIIEALPAARAALTSSPAPGDVSAGSSA